jgi:TolB-like protein/DNA-binding winged helix-turn-helix (wHTH) protein
MQSPSVHLYEFGGFKLDSGRRLLWRTDGTPVPLTPRVFETLLYMVEHHDAVVDKERIMEAVWPDSIVEENNLAQAISKLRHVFGETPGSHSYIMTVPGRGYRFIADVSERTADTIQMVNTKGVRQKSIRNPAHAALTIKGPWLAVKAVGAAVLATAIIALPAFLFVHYRAANSSTLGGTASSTVPQIPEKSVAVLPFENLTDDKQNDYFAAGIQDETISDLATIADLKVISRTSANHYKSETARNSRDIAQQLGVTHLVEGSIQRMDNRLRVHAQLIDARTDMHVWAQTYDRDVADLFAIQSEIARAIAEQLHAKISPAAQSAIDRAPTVDLTAFDLYTRAKNLFLTASSSNSGKEDLLLAINLLNQAVGRDPRFLQAYCQLGWTHDLLYILGDDHTPARLALAEGAIEAAFRLRPDAGEAHLARAENLYRGYLDYNDALGELEIAGQSLPNDSRVFELKAAIERRLGKFEEALRNFARETDLDPRNISTLQQIALTYGYLRRYAEAKSAIDHALDVEPNDVVTKVGRAYLEMASRADTAPLHQMIDTIRAENPVAVRDVADTWLGCALAERDVNAAKNALITAGQNPPINDEAIHFNRSFAEGVIARMTKDEGEALSAFITARAEQEKIIQTQPNYGPPLCVLGLIDAALGRKEEALREGRRAIELLPVDKDAINGPLMLEYFAMIAAWTGDKGLACEQLATAVRYPSSLCYGQLKLSPFWDALRGEPCFEQIVASLAPKNE